MSETKSTKLTDEQTMYLEQLRAASNELRVYGKAAIADIEDAMKGTFEGADEWPGAPSTDAWSRASRAGAKLEGLIAAHRSVFPVVNDVQDAIALRKAFNKALAGQDWR